MFDKLKSKFKEYKDKILGYKDEILTGAFVAGGLYIAYQVVQPLFSIFGGGIVFLGLAYLAYRKRDKIREYFNKVK